jgi:predicted DNA-binding transcriptional regulator AlpA
MDDMTKLIAAIVRKEIRAALAEVGLPSNAGETTPAPAVMTERDAAEYLQMKPGTLRNWRSEGRGPKFIRLGAAVRYRPVELDEWISAH